MIGLAERLKIVGLLVEAIRNGARQQRACRIVGLSVRTFQRWQLDMDSGDGRPLANKPAPAHKLTDEERAQILRLCHSPEFVSVPPSWIVPTLADRGIYIASESSFYRVLRAAKEQNHRGRSRAPRKVGKPRMHTACWPNQVWCWDVTWLKGPAKGIFFYLYMIVDIFSRKIVGWEVWEAETGEKAAQLVQKAVLREGCSDTLEVYHADNGAIQKSSTLRVKLEALGVEASYSRPRVSDDNAFSESLFRTCKYRPDFPYKGFATIEDARRWVYQFVEWYNHSHLHSGIRFVSPADKHAGKDGFILLNRTAVYEKARAKNPARWSGKIRCWEPISKVYLNRPKDEKVYEKAA